MLRKLRRSIASFAVVAIIASLSVASAVSAFSDVSESDWYYTNVQDLVDAGVIDGTKDKFNGGANLNRAEAAKIAVLAAGVAEEDLVNPETPSFSDVPKSLWAYKYIETAKSLGYVSGDAGKSTFRPGANVNRAEYAKMMGLALELEENTDGGPHFSDVKAADWFYGYVETAYNWSVVNGYEGGMFKPAAAINRAEMSKMTVAAMDPTERVAVTPAPGVDCTATPTAEGCVVVPPSAAGDVTIAVSGAQGEATLTKGSVGTSVLTFSVSAGVDTTVNSLKFTRTGVGLSTDYSNAYIYDGATRLKSGKSLASDTNSVEFTNLGIALKKGESKVLTLKVDVYASAGTGDVNYMNVLAAGDVGVTGGTVKGVFPVTGAKITIGSQAIGTSVVENSSSVSKPVLGQSAAKLANLKVTAGVNDIDVNALTLTQNGSFANTGIKNLLLKYAGDTVATAAMMTGEKAVFTFAKPFSISKNQNRTFELYGDLSGGKTSDTIRFYLEETTDMTILDKQYTQNSAVTNSFGSTAAYCVGAASNTCPTAGSLQGGAVTLSDQGPAATNVSRNSTGKTLFAFNLTSSRNVTLKDYYLTMEQTSWDGSTAVKLASTTITAGAASAAGAITGLTLASATGAAVNDVIKLVSDDGTRFVRIATESLGTYTGTVIETISISGAVTYGATGLGANAALQDDTAKTAIEVYDNHLKTYMKNVKLVDLDSNNTLASSANSDFVMTLSDDFDITAGQTRHLAVKADLDTALVAANAFKAGVDFTAASTIKDNDANQYIAVSDVVAGNTVGKVMTVQAASLTVTRASTPVSTTVVKGVQNVDVLGLSMAASSSADVKVTQLTVRLLGDDDGTFDSGEGDTAANSLIDSVSLYVDGSVTPLAGPKALSLVGTIGSDGGYYSATFDSMSYVVKAGTTPKLVVKANVKNTISATRYLAATVTAGASGDIVAQDLDGNVLTVALTTDGSVNDNDGNATANDDTTPPVILTLATSGSLAASVEGSPSSALVVAGTTNVTFAKYKFNAVNESYVIDKLSVIGDTSGTFGTASAAADNNIVRVGLQYTNKAGVVTTAFSNLSSGTANFSGLEIYVPKDGNAYVTLIADMNTIAGGATSGATPRFGLSAIQSTANTFNAVGESSSETKIYDTLSSVAGESNVFAMTVRKSAPTIAKATGSASLINGENSIYSFTAAADAKGGVALKRVVLSTSFTATLNVSDLRFYRGASDITSSVSIRNAAGQNLKTGGSNLVTSSGSATSDQVYVTWDKSSTDEEAISAGTTNTYTLKATVSNAAAGKSISTYIADDSVAGDATSTSAGVATLRTSTVASGENAAASTNGTRQVWRWATAATIYLDVNGSGDYEAASDYLVAVTLGTGDAAYTVDQVIPGKLLYTTTDIDAGAGGNAGVYFDLNGDAGYVAGDDIGVGVIKSTDAFGPADNDAVTTKMYADVGGVKLFIDGTDGITAANGTYAAGDDTKFIAADVTAPSTATATNAEAYTSNTNLVWTDLSNTSHTTSTVDWTNGYNVNDLATASLTLSL